MIKIPFSWLPASWGLKGTTRQIAEAEYYLNGEALERALVDINENDIIERQYLNLDIDLKYEHITAYDHAVLAAKIAFIQPDKLIRALIDINRKHGKITEYEYDIECLQFTDEADREIARLDIEFKHNKIVERVYNLERATLKEEPYVAVINSEYNPKEGMNGLYFEFDWNQLWIEYLRLNGYTGLTDELLLEQWFTDVCRSVVNESPDDDSADVPFNSGRVIKRVRREGGKTEYS